MLLIFYSLRLKNWY